MLVDQRHQLESLLDSCGGAPRIALDTEGNGLHAYRSAPCTMQLAWPHEASVEVAVIDTLALEVEPLRQLLGPEGPVKVLHDLTFDARMLQESGIRLGHVRDTSVAARFLGETSTGLAALVESRLGVTLDKGLQEHDWACRPLTPDQLGYLAGDVRHLLELDGLLQREAFDRDITTEVDLECQYKLASALAPPRDTRPRYARITGFTSLDAVAQAILRRLVQTREEIAERADEPPFRIASNQSLLDLARRRPRTFDQFRRWFGRKGKLLPHQTLWLGAIRRGLRDGTIPAEEQAMLYPRPMSPPEVKARKRMQKALQRWRATEAERRGVDIQVVLPTHCFGPIIDAVRQACSEAEAGERLPAVPGLGACRVEAYGAAIVQLLTSAAAAVDPGALPASPPAPRR